MGRWPQGVKLFWYLESSDLLASDLPQVSAPIKAGIESWNRVCGVQLERARGAAQAQLVVRFVADLAGDPGAGTVNAQAWIAGNELGLTDEPTPGATVPLIMRLNPRATEGWTVLSLEEVARHEAGHFLGFDHSPPGTPSCMEAILDQRVSTQTPYDVAVAQATYGAPSSPSPAPAITPAQPAAVPSPATGSPAMNPLLVLAETEALVLVHNEVKAGSTVDVAVRNVLGQLEGKITNPTAKQFVTDVLTGLVNAAEKAAAALPTP